MDLTLGDRLNRFALGGTLYAANTDHWEAGTMLVILIVTIAVALCTLKGRGDNYLKAAEIYRDEAARLRARVDQLESELYEEAEEEPQR